MTDRLPTPMHDAGPRGLHATERASATPTTAGPARKAMRARASSVDHPATSLAEVQRWMLGAITEPSATLAGIERVLTAGPRLTAEDRLEVYRTGYRARLLECLRDDYPVLAQTVGEDCFDALGHAYIEAHPSSNPNLNFFGRHMAALCRSADVPGLSPFRTFVVGLAALEWAMVEVLHAEVPAPFDLAALQAIPLDAWATARFVVSDAVRLLRFDHPVNPYYQACRMGQRPAELPSPAPSATVVYRRDVALWRMDLTPAMTDVLDALLTGASIGDALARMGIDTTDADALAEAERSVMVWFREWVNGGLFGGVCT
jgi:hypothetical protein